MDHHVNTSRDRSSSNLKTLAMASSNNAFPPNAVQLGTPAVSSSYAQFFQSNNWLSNPNSPMGTPGAVNSPSLSGTMQSSSALPSWQQLHNQNSNVPQYQNVSHVSGITPTYYSNGSESTPQSQFSPQYSQMPHIGAGQSQPKSASPVPSAADSQTLAPKPMTFSSYGHSIQPKQFSQTSYQQHTPPYQAPGRLASQNQNQAPGYQNIVNYQTGILPGASPQLASNHPPASHASFNPPPIKYETSQNTPPAPIPLITNPNLMIINAENLSRVTNSRTINHGIALSNELPESSYSKVAQLPRYDPRKNLRELRQVADHDPDLKAKFEKLDKKARSKLMYGSLPAAQLQGAGLHFKFPPSSSSESDSADDSDYSDELEIGEKLPLPPSRPTDPVKAAEYDMIKSVWHSRSSYIPDDVLLSRIQQFSELFFKLRDRWKGSREALAKATELKQNDQLASLRSNVKRNRNIVESALNAAVQHGHPHVLEMLSENKKLLAGLYMTLLAQIQDKDFSGSLTVLTLKFLAKLTRVVTESLEQTKLTKAILLISKKGSDEIKSLIKGILDKAAINSQKSSNSVGSPSGKSVGGAKANGPSTERIAGDGKPTASPNSKSSDTSKFATKLGDGKAKPENPAELDSTLKRPRPADGTASQSIKRQAVTHPSSTKAATGVTSTIKRPLTTVGSKSSATSAASLNMAPKIKQVITPAKVSSTGSTTASGVKKTTGIMTGQSTSLPARSANASSLVQPAFSFGGMMEGILNPKHLEADQKVEEEKPKETEEQEIKRRRKEARRKLRVSWKQDHELEAVRYFTHDPDEETGHDASSMRDVGDVGTEGRMFKQLHKDHREIVDVDMDEEEREETFLESPYPVPTSIDFDDIDDAEREKNYSQFGGGKLEPDSTDRQKQEEREASTLMAIYITRADIPPRPQSPVEPYPGEVVNILDFGSPSDEVRQRERALNPAAAAKAPVAASSDVEAPNIQDILRVLAPTTQLPAQQPTPPPQPPAAQPPAATQPTSDLFATLQQYSTQMSGQTQPAAPIMPQASYQPAYQPASQPSEALSNPLLSGIFGGASFAPPAAAPTLTTPNTDLTAILAQLQGLNQPAPQPQPVAPPPPPAAPAQPPNVADILAQLGFAQQQQNPGYAGYPLAQQLQQDTSQYSGPYENPDRKRVREMNDDDQDESPWNKRPNNMGQVGDRGNGGNFKKWDPNQRKPKWSFDDNPKKFSLPCKFWPDRCTKGAKCTYRHDS